MIPNGIDVDRFIANEDVRVAMRAKLGIAQGAPVVGIVAALRPEKNHSLFVKMANEVLHVLPDANS